MKILHLIYNFASGGAERFAVDLCNEQKRQGHDVTILCVNDLDFDPERSHYRSEVAEDIKILSAGSKAHITLRTLLSLTWMIRKSDADIVHVHTCANIIYLPAFLSGKKIVWTIHSVVPYYITDERNKKWTMSLYIKKKLFPVTISKQCHDLFLKVYGQSLDRLIFNGRSPIALTEKSEDVKAEIAALKKDVDTPVFIHVARYSKEKNQTLLFNAFKKLYENNIDFCLIVIGVNYSDDNKSEAEQCPNIHILGSKTNVGDYLNVSNYFVLSSVFEGLPISLLEGMSKGCIPISTPAGGIVDVIQDGETGFISPSHELDDYVATIKRALADKHVTPQMVIDDYTSKYTMEICAKNYIELYSEISTSKKSK